jgi:hypothetical protein
MFVLPSKLWWNHLKSLQSNPCRFVTFHESDYHFYDESDYDFYDESDYDFYDKSDYDFYHESDYDFYHAFFTALKVY